MVLEKGDKEKEESSSLATQDCSMRYWKGKNVSKGDEGKVRQIYYSRWGPRAKKCFTEGRKVQYRSSFGKY